MRFSSFSNSRADTKHSNSIQLKLPDINRLFNSMDPSPFIEKDLDDDAAEFIVSWAQEFSPASPVKLKMYLEQWPTEDPSVMIRHAVHFYFAHRAQMAALDFKRLMKQGQTSLLIGLVFLVACLVATTALLTGQESTWANTLRESLTIAGWVAMWRPMPIYLYDWRPLRQKRRTYAKLSRMPVEVVAPKTK